MCAALTSPDACGCVRGAAAAERNGRVQEQTVSMKRVGEDLMLLSQRLDTEKNARCGGQAGGEEQLRALVLEERTCLAHLGLMRNLATA